MSGPRNVRHAYIIYISREESIEYANECARSCEEHGMPYTLWKGVEQADSYKASQETGFTFKMSNGSGEIGCTASHLKLWRVIAEQPHACCVFEHDAIVCHNFFNIEIPDDKLVMLGYRVGSKGDYVYPGGETSFIDIPKFEGTHSYCITPNMAKLLINKMEGEYTSRFGGVDTTIDGILSIQDNIGITKCIMDPPPVVCVVGNRVSTIQGRPADYNTSPSPGFIKGLQEGKQLRVMN